MSTTTLILGESGTGKSTSIANLDPKETFIINVLNKPLPFRGFAKKYIHITGWDDTTGNYYASDDSVKIMRCIKMVTDNRPDIKNLIIDDWQYTMCNEFMRRASEKGYDKFTEIGKHAWEIINALTACRADMYTFVLSHSELDQNGRSKCKTIGKMLEDKITVEGMFTTVLHTNVRDGAYRFLTQNDGAHLAKSPQGMFKDRYIANDLSYVKTQMDEFFFGDVAI